MITLLLSFTLFVAGGVLFAEDAAPVPAPAPAAAAAAGGADSAAPSAPDAEALQKELRALQFEIYRARRAIEKDERVVAIRALQKEAVENKDIAAAREHSAEARALVETLLAEQPGMPEKLARLKEIGETLRSVLPAEQRRKGRRLPRAEVEAEEKAAEAETPAAPAPETPAP